MFSVVLIKLVAYFHTFQLSITGYTLFCPTIIQ